MWSYPERLKSVYMALIGIFAVYISTHKLMLGNLQLQLPNIEGCNVYKQYIQINSQLLIWDHSKFKLWSNQ
jgi:hypothetical protein